MCHPLTDVQKYFFHDDATIRNTQKCDLTLELMKLVDVKTSIPSTDRISVFLHNWQYEWNTSNVWQSFNSFGDLTEAHMQICQTALITSATRIECFDAYVN